MFKNLNPFKKDDTYVIPDILYDDISTFDEVKKHGNFINKINAKLSE